jgi:hypothetical protein
MFNIAAKSADSEVLSDPLIGAASIYIPIYVSETAGVTLVPWLESKMVVNKEAKRFDPNVETSPAFNYDYRKILKKCETSLAVQWYPKVEMSRSSSACLRGLCKLQSKEFRN